MRRGRVVATAIADQVAGAARDATERGAKALVIAFINSYANSANENAAEAAVREIWPNEFVTTSNSILSEIREFERTSTAALNGYLQPVVSTYLANLERELEGEGFDGEFLVVQSNGGVATSAEARRLPVRTALSGPAAGVIAATRTAGEAGIENIITCDMGGTSFDVALVASGQPTFAQQSSIELRPRRPHADDRDHHYRRWWRLDRDGGRRGNTEDWAGVGGFRSRTRGVRTRQRPSDRHRRESRTRADRP